VELRGSACPLYLEPLTITHPLVDADAADVGEPTGDLVGHAEEDVELVDDVGAEVVDDVVVLPGLFLPRRTRDVRGREGSVSVIVGRKVDELSELRGGSAGWDKETSGG
jgi:hypothetical protein